MGSFKLSDYLEALTLVRPHRGRSMMFRSAGNRALVDALERGGDFCRDTRVGGALHPGRLSYRQTNRTPGLHIIFEPKDRLTAHLDVAAPATGRASDGRCVYRGSRAARHVLLDLLPMVATAGAHYESPRQSEIPRRESWASSVPLPVLRLGRPTSIHRSGLRAARSSTGVPWRAPPALRRVPDACNFLRGPPYPVAGRF